MDMNNVNIEEIVKQVLSGMTGNAPAQAAAVSYTHLDVYKRQGWHDAALFNMCRPLELVFSNGMDKGELVGIQTGDVTQMTTFEEFYDAYKKQMEYCISLLVNADNAIDVAHAERVPLPFESCMVDDCISRGLAVQEGGAVYNFTGPQGFGIANMACLLYTSRCV